MLRIAPAVVNIIRTSSSSHDHSNHRSLHTVLIADCVRFLSHLSTNDSMIDALHDVGAFNPLLAVMKVSMREGFVFFVVFDIATIHDKLLKLV
jgi:hypothetical protein